MSDLPISNTVALPAPTQHIRQSTPTGHHQQSTSSHPPAQSHDPTTAAAASLIPPADQQDGAQAGELPAAPAASTTELTNLTLSLRRALRQFPDFPSPGILFEDIMPIFASASLHASLLRALELHIVQAYGADNRPDVIVGLEARGFLFGPSLALRLGAGFVPVRKRGKLPGPTETASYKKEYGEDFFQMQADAVAAGQKVLIVDDIIATGGSAAAAGSLVRKLGGHLLGYVFIMELDFLKGRAKLDAPVYTLLSSQ